jgi:uncharacterized repeat protein (TIGR03843 family)
MVDQPPDTADDHARPANPPTSDRGRLLEVLRAGTVQPAGRMPFASNATFLAEVTLDDDRVLAVYKPLRGERPLWDFPAGLHRREVAAWELSEALGWDLVPPTVLRGDDAPMGEGSLQAFVHADVEQHYFTFLEDEDLHHQLRRACAFDLAANNTDRKGGHLLIDEHGHVWAIDNGLSFHAEFKLRTVIWDFAGEPVPDDIAVDLARLVAEGLPPRLAELLDPFERDAVLGRTRALLELGCFPHDPTGRRWPWPLV